MADKVINMVMLGPSRVGKSSLLATMSREISKLKSGFELIPMDETNDRLDEAFHNLSRVMNQEVFAPVGVHLKGTMEFIELRFEVSFKGKKEFDLVFQDFRGGAMMHSGNDLNTLRENVARSHVIFNVLDAVALMELDVIDGDKLNGHDRVKILLTKALKAGEKYLIVFVLVKCETYVKTASGRESLVKRFEERHGSVLQLIQKLNETNKNVVALLVPAITLGCVEFQEIDRGGNFIFVRIPHKEFKPEHVDQPLRYALSFALNHVNVNRGWWESFINWFTGKGKEFDQALKDFYRQRDGSYRKYGNEALLEEVK